MTTPLTKEEILRLYPSSYSGHLPHLTGPEELQNPNRRLSIFKRLIHTIKGYIRYLIEWLKGMKIKRSLYKKLTKSSRVLDVGCGSGEFLYNIKEDRGVQPYGVELSKPAAQRGVKLFGIDIFNGELTDAPLEPKSFDLITAWWSLEHIPDPETLIKRMKSLLKDDGNMIIGIPNSKSMNAWIFKDRWYHLDCPRHLHLWNIPAIKTLIERNGLKITDIFFDKTPWGLLGSLQYLFYQNNFSEKHKNRITRNFILYLVALPWTIFVGLLRLSDIMIVYCKKQ